MRQRLKGETVMVYETGCGLFCIPVVHILGGAPTAEA